MSDDITTCSACGHRWPTAILDNSGRCPQCGLDNVPVIPAYAEPEPLIDAERVVEILKDCLFKDSEIEGDMTDPTNLPDNAVIVEGIIHPFGFHKERLESHSAEIATMLQGLPNEFRDIEHGGGGGWSFLNACQDANDVQWTGFHQTMDALFVLGIGLDLAAWLMPRDMWSILPGGMPYVVVKV